MLRMPDKRRQDSMLSPTAEWQRKSPLCLLSCMFLRYFCVREIAQFWGLPVLNVRNFQCNFMDILWDSTGASSNGCPEAAGSRDLRKIHPDAKGTGPKCYFKHLIYFKCTFLLWVILHLSRWGVLITKWQRRGPQWISEWNTRLWFASPGRMLAEQTRVNVRLPWFHSSLWLVPKG